MASFVRGVKNGIPSKLAKTFGLLHNGNSSVLLEEFLALCLLDSMIFQLYDNVLHCL